MMRSWLVALACAAACGGSHANTPGSANDGPDDPGDSPFIDRADYKPKSFDVEVTGEGRAVIFIPGIGCPGSVWDETVAHFDGKVQSHVLTLAGFAGKPRIRGPLSPQVRRELVRYIHSRRLEKPIVVGHSMGGFLAYWLAVTSSDDLGGVIVVDAGPSLSNGDLADAKVLRNAWAQAGDDEVIAHVRAAFSSMTKRLDKMQPVIEKVARSDREALGDAVYEMVRTDLRPRMKDITAPVLLVLADGGMASTYREGAAKIPDHQVVVLPGTHHFVMFDDPEAWYATLDKFIAAH
jgi:N-formylmaleamate deformylase